MPVNEVSEKQRLIDAAIRNAESITVRIDATPFWYTRRDANVRDQNEDYTPKKVEYDPTQPGGGKLFQLHADSIRNRLNQEARELASNIEMRFNPSTRTVRYWPYEIKVNEAYHNE